MCEGEFIIYEDTKIVITRYTDRLFEIQFEV